MASEVDVCNMALAHIGAESQVASIAPPDGSVEAGYCARFYPTARRVALESEAWTFAKKRETLAAVESTPLVQNRSFMPIGTPASGLSVSPAARAASAASAAAMA